MQDTSVNSAQHSNSKWNGWP